MVLISSLGQYAAAVMGLLPTGRLWRREPDTVLANLSLSLGAEGQTIDLRAFDLVDETDPRKTVELLADFERVLGLPDECIGELTGLARRRNLVVARLIYQGGQSVGFLVDLAGMLGYAVTIEEPGQFLAGYSVAGDPVTNGEWVHVFEVHAEEETVTLFLAGAGAAGDRLAEWGNAPLECVINRAKPSHSLALFLYDLPPSDA